MTKNEKLASRKSNFALKMVGLAMLVIATGLTYWKFGKYISLEYLAKQESQLQAFQERAPLLVIGITFLIYVSVTGLSIPGATILSLVVGWYFGFWKGLFFVSFASTSGATVAFLLSRYFFRDSIERRFASRLKKFNQSLEREGPFYLFT